MLYEICLSAEYPRQTLFPGGAARRHLCCDGRADGGEGRGFGSPSLVVGLEGGGWKFRDPESENRRNLNRCGRAGGSLKALAGERRKIGFFGRETGESLAGGSLTRLASSRSDW